MWQRTEQRWAGPICAVTVNVYGDPAFVDPGTGGYHMGMAPAAIHAGMADDIEGDLRIYGCGVDMGADEYVGSYDPSVGTLEPNGVWGRRSRPGSQGLVSATTPSKDR